MEQPKALRLADTLAAGFECDLEWYEIEAAKELRRLHHENQTLHAALEQQITGHDKTLDELRIAEQELKALRADAERYRWLRETRFIHSDFSYIAHNSKKVVGLEFGWFDAPDGKVPTRNDLDDALDAERAKNASR